MAEAAQVLGIAQATAEEDWTYSKAWLRRQWLRGEVEALLQAHERPLRLLGVPSAGAPTTNESRPQDHPGAAIGGQLDGRLEDAALGHGALRRSDGRSGFPCANGAETPGDFGHPGASLFWSPRNQCRRSHALE